MSATAVEAAVANYITGAAIPNLVACLANPPFDMENVPVNAFTPAGTTTSAVGVVYVDTDEDEVIALDGAGGRRKCTYTVSLEVLLWDVSGDATVAGNAYDTLVDAIKVRLRTDPMLGTTPAGASGDIIQAAVSRLFVERGRPVLLGNGNVPARWAGVQFAVETYEYST